MHLSSVVISELTSDCAPRDRLDAGGYPKLTMVFGDGLGAEARVRTQALVAPHA